jgi:hypothetical protein
MDRGAGLRGIVGVRDLEEADKQACPLVDLPQPLARSLAALLDGRQRLGQAIPLMFEANELGRGFGARSYHPPC